MLQYEPTCEDANQEGQHDSLGNDGEQDSHYRREKAKPAEGMFYHISSVASVTAVIVRMSDRPPTC